MTLLSFQIFKAKVFFYIYLDYKCISSECLDLMTFELKIKLIKVGMPKFKEKDKLCFFLLKKKVLGNEKFVFLI